MNAFNVPGTYSNFYSLYISLNDVEISINVKQIVKEISLFRLRTGLYRIFILDLNCKLTYKETSIITLFRIKLLPLKF